MKVTHKSVKSFDGTKIGYQIIGQGSKTIILCNGLGGSIKAWIPLCEHLGKHYRCLTWDYRGLLRSDPPEDYSKLTVLDHVQDLEAIFKQEKITKALVSGWSMGVQVSLEFYRRHQKKVSGLLLINGTYGYPFHTVFNSPFSKYIFPVLNDLSQKISPAIQPSVRPFANRILDSEHFIKTIKTLGLVHKNINVPILQDVAKELISADLDCYHEIMKHLNNHDASDVLPLIKVPTLIIAGDEDKLTPMRVSEHMFQTINKAEFFVVPHGTHYSLLEFPDLIRRRIEQFLKEHYAYQKREIISESVK